MSLAAMQFLTVCIGLKSISLSRAQEIISILRDTYGYDTEGLSDILIEASAESDYSIEYEDLLFHIHSILSKCIDSVIRKCNTYTVSQYIRAFHNYPRAFFRLPIDLKSLRGMH